ncbi:MAG: helix-turn-helix transcriptional regulator [Enhydrobacter sp.]|nr:helix-turn-helix transcriptional regulator [Enhydrobacter sp.]
MLPNLPACIKFCAPNLVDSLRLVSSKTLCKPRGMPAPSDINAILERLRVYRRAAGLSLSGFAIKAGLSRSALGAMDREDWSPTADTIRAMEQLIPSGWKVGDPIPNVTGAQDATPPEEVAA